MTDGNQFTLSEEKYVDFNSEVKKGDLILTVKGKTAVLLKGERTALNLIQHMSGISTASNKYAKIVEGTNASIANSRLRFEEGSTALPASPIPNAVVADTTDTTESHQYGCD